MKKLDVRKQRRLEPLEPGSDLAETSVRDFDFAVKKILDDPALSIGENMSPHVSSDVTVTGKRLNILCSNSCNTEYCASEREAKNLVETESRTEKRAAGATMDVKSLLFQYAWWLKKEGYAESTITTRVKLLNILAKRGANLKDPESIKEKIAQQEWSQGRKANAVDAYTRFLMMLEMEWSPPRYKRIRKLPFIPTESEVDQLIAGCSFRTGTFLHLLKETGMRSGEAWNLEWIDVDTVRGTVNVTPEKGSNPRIFKISRALMERLKALPNNSLKIFAETKLKTIRKSFETQRKRIAAKTKNPRLLRITFHTFRHWKATMEYHRTKDILHVMRLLGHKNINNTLLYTQLINFDEDDYVSKVAWNLEEICKLVEAGFEYVCEMDGATVFKKRK